MSKGIHEAGTVRRQYEVASLDPVVSALGSGIPTPWLA